MNATLKLAAPLVAALAIAACGGGSSNMPGTGGMMSTDAGQVVWARSGRVPQWAAKHRAREACPQVVGRPTCLVLTLSKGGLSPAVAGWAPIDFQKRYRLPIGQGSGQLVAIVDAFDQPNAASDLAVYRNNFGLGTAPFTKYNQNGQTSNYPQKCYISASWCVEVDLDIEMVSAVCPKCSIALIESDGSIAGMEASEATAVSLGAPIVSNSWICYMSLDCGDASFATFFDTPGVVYLAASGDAGYNFNGAPEALAGVVSVGGTELQKNGSKYSETAWSAAGGGCSDNGTGAGVTKPSWQHDPSCSYRTDSDVSAVADGVAEYDLSHGGWFTVGGTSVATPIVAGIFALAGNADSQNVPKKFWVQNRKQDRRGINAITEGDNGSCGGSYLCTAGTHQFRSYSGPGGWGTPKGTKAF